MAWNEPGGQDPWGGRKNNGNNNNGGPPDLDEALKQFQRKINRIFGGDGGGSSDKFPAFLVPLILVITVILYIFLGFYQLDEQEEAVVLRFGEYHATKGAGLRWNPPLIDKVYRERVTQERQYQTTGEMLTKDESIVFLPVTVQYNISDIKAFVLNVKDPVVSLQQATDSALRHVVGSTEMNKVLSLGRAEIAMNLRDRLVNTLANYQSGINVIAVNIQEGTPPEEVKHAFDNVIKAKEDQARFKEQAEAYQNAILPKAQGLAARLEQEAKGYAKRVEEEAEGNVARLKALSEQYTQSPEILRERLYIESVEAVLSQVPKVFVDSDAGNNMMYLPLDRIATQIKAKDPSTSDTASQFSEAEIRDLVKQMLEDKTKTNRGNRRGLR